MKSCLRRWVTFTGHCRASVVYEKRLQRQKQLWFNEGAAHHIERSKRLEFQLEQMGQLKQSEGQDRKMLHSYLAHTGKSMDFVLDVVKSLRKEIG